MYSNRYYAPAQAEALSDDAVWRLSVCRSLSVAYIGPKSRTEAWEDQNWHRGSPHRTWLRHHFQGQRSRSPGRFAHRRVGASGGCSGGHGNVLAVGNCCYVAVWSAAQGASAPTGEERGGTYRGGRPPTACHNCYHCPCYLSKYLVYHKRIRKNS